MKRRMKRLLALGIGILMIGVSACGSKTPAETSEKPKTEQTDQGSSTEEQEETDETDNGETEDTEKEPDMVEPENSETEDNKEDPEQSENTETQPVNQNKEVNEEVFDEMINSLSQYEEGTAGASLKRLKAAFGILNFSEQYESSQKESFTQKLQAYLAEEEAMSAEDMKLKLEGLDPTVQQAFTEGIASMQDQLSDAGNPNHYDTYTEQKYQDVIKVMEEVLNDV